MENTIETLQTAIQGGRGLEDVAAYLATEYTKPSEDTEIVGMLNDLGVAVFVANMNSLKFYCNDAKVPSHLKCYTLRGKALKRLHGNEFAAAVDTHLSVSEKRFWLAYCLGCILTNRWTQNAFWVEESTKLEDDDECRKFALRLIAPFA